MTVTATAHAPLKELFRWEPEVVFAPDLPAGANTYESPAALADEVEELQERVVWFFPPVWLLIALGGALLVGAYIYCTRKGMHFYAVFRLNRYRAKVGCKKR